MAINYNKFKYLTNIMDVDIERLYESCRIVDNPTKYDNLPDGQYHFRGTNKGEFVIYEKIGRVWSITRSTQEITRTEMHSLYGLYPNLPHKEYVELKQRYSEITPTEQLNVDAYFLWFNKEFKRKEFVYKFCYKLRKLNYGL